MAFPPNNNNHNNDPHSELELLEGLLNNMFSGATNMIFQTLQEPFLTEVDQQQQQQQHSYSPMMEDLDGSDFRRIAEKKRQQRQQQSEDTAGSNDNKSNNFGRLSDNPTASLTPINSNRSSTTEYYRSMSNPDSLISNGLGGIVAALLGDFDPSTHPASQDNNNNQGWAFTSSSTSQRRTVRPDGTEEAVITTTHNGKTETTTTIKLPDGTIQETRNIGERPSIMSLLSSAPASFSRNIDDNSSVTPPPPSSTSNPLSKLFRSIWG